MILPVGVLEVLERGEAAVGLARDEHVVVAGDALDDVEVVDAGDLVLADGERGDREEGGVLVGDGRAVGLGLGDLGRGERTVGAGLLITGKDAPSSSQRPLDDLRG